MASYSGFAVTIIGDKVSLGPPEGLPFLAQFVTEEAKSKMRRQQANMFFTVRNFSSDYKVTIYLANIESKNLKVNGMCDRSN